MKKLILLLFVLCSTVYFTIGQDKYAILISGEYDQDNISYPSTEQWNNGNLQGSDVFDEFWNDTYLMWEMLIRDKSLGGKEFLDQNVHVLFANSFDYIFEGQDERYTAEHNNYLNVTDDFGTYSSINNKFTQLATTITEDDFLFVWVMSHGGTDATGSYFYSYDAQKIYDTQLASWLSGINAHKKTIFLSFPSSGGFTDDLQSERTVVIISSQENESAIRADNNDPNGNPLVNLENEMIV